MKKSNRLLTILGYFLDYAPIITTVVLATFASLRANQAGIPEMLQWILAVLALLATTQLVERFRTIRNLTGKMEKLVETTQGRAGAKAFFVRSLPDLEDRLREARSISINGISLVRTSSSLWSVFKERVEQGAQVRILVVDPEHHALELAASRFRKHQDPVRLRREVELALGNLEPLRVQYASSQLFQIRLLPFPPAYGIWVIDAGTAKAEIWVELYSFRDLPEPTFHLLPSRDGEWFEFFERQFEIMWNASREWNPQSSRDNEIT